MEWDKNGYNERTNTYKSRYYAKKAAFGDEIVVKWGPEEYRIMKATEWVIWKKQK